MDSAARARDLIYGNIDAIMNNAQRLRAMETVTLATLLDPDFMQRHTTLQSVEEMFALAGQTEVSEKALDAIADDRWQEIVTTCSPFASWSEMFAAASQAYVRKSLLQGIG